MIVSTRRKHIHNLRCSSWMHNKRKCNNVPNVRAHMYVYINIWFAWTYNKGVTPEKRATPKQYVL
jgi:hypothetical protein